MVSEGPQRFEAASALSLLGAVLLLVSPFLAWFEPGGSGWELFELLDLVLLGIAAAAGVLATMRLLILPTNVSGRAMPVLGAIGFVAVLATIAQPPPDAFDADVRFGAWLALFSCALIVGGGMLDAARISVSVSVGGRPDEPPVPPADPPAPPSTPERAAPPAWPDPSPGAGRPSTDAPPSRAPSLLGPDRGRPSDIPAPTSQPSPPPSPSPSPSPPTEDTPTGS